MSRLCIIHIVLSSNYMIYEQESISKLGVLFHKCGLYQLLYKHRNTIFHVASIKLDPLLSEHQSHNCCIHSGSSRSKTTYNISALNLNSQREGTQELLSAENGYIRYSSLQY